jgi:hypothetical protein
MKRACRSLHHDEAVDQVTCGVAAAGTVVFVSFSVDVRPREEYVPEPVAICSGHHSIAARCVRIPMSGYSMEQGKVRSRDTFGGLWTAWGGHAT